ncbi:hypothetical protein AJ79_03325 [Helicocarpus griseus UAMH5409]|uniref:Nucleolar 27S pre-rRNA processing Urb2/Npa2 C-terminal domain-containing protein n=1 Tax=Helicocarpus griseus UAMH5409 TaxID=1447875 RepID=A0A2B7XY03_9EURO|nr:hypothetical protein AJ79_03325 [Helicocarpus griseus UAMH5409]
MAPLQESPRSAHQALLELEKGTSGPASQLQEAARIIGVDLSSQYDLGKATSTAIQKLSAPKEEWVLRWLMKKLKASSQQQQQGQSSYRLDAKTWILLQQLFDRIPAKPLAFILSENKFLSILEDSLTDLVNALNIRAEQASANDTRNSESSATLQESPVSISSKRGQKRKRTEDGSGFTGSVGGLPGLWIDTLCAIIGSVKVLVTLPEQLPEVNSTAASQLKLVLRGEPPTAATVLGRSFELARNAIEEMDKGFPALETQLLSALSSLLEIWRLSSERVGDANNMSTKDAFASHCLSEALDLLLLLRRVTNESGRNKSLVQGIERIVVLQFVLPLRHSFFSKFSPESTNVNNSPDRGQINLVFNDLTSLWKQGDGKSNTKLLPTLLDIAIRAIPRDTFRGQVNEAPWLETFFVVLSTIAGCPLFENPSWNAFDLDIPVLGNLLQVAVDSNVSLSIVTVSRYATRYSGLFNGQPKKLVQWSLISKIIRAGVDVFLPNSGVKEGKDLLNNLITQITILWLGSNSISTETYAVIKNGIVIPLLSGFSSARVIGSFLEIWSEQLKCLEAARLMGTDVSYFSVWEDDDLAAAYKPLMSNTFSENQTKDRLRVILTEHSFEDENYAAEQYADVVLLDAILKPRLRQGDTLIQGDALNGLFNITSEFVTSKRKLQWRWRLWRLSQRFADQHASIGNPLIDLRKTLLPTAVKILRSFHRGSTSVVSRNDCLEAFEAFKFIVLVAGRVESNEESEYLNAIIPKIAPSISQVAKCTAPAWDGRADSLTTPQTVCVANLVVLLSTPLAVSRLTSENRTVLFNTILTTVGRSNSDVSVSPFAHGQIDLRGLLLEIWQEFSSHEWLLEAPAAAYDLVNTVYNELKDKSNPRHLWIVSLLSIPTRLIPRHQRGMLLDFLQQTLLRGQLNSWESRTDILTLMTRLSDLPKSSAQITSDWEQLWKLSSAISPPKGDSSTVLPFQSFRQLHQAIIDRVLVSSDVQRRSYLRKTFDKVSATVRKYDKPNFETLEFFMVGLSLRTLRNHHEHFDGNLKVETLNALREKVFNVLISDLRGFEKSMKNEGKQIDVNVLTGVLNSLEDFEDLVKEAKEAQKAIRKLEERMNTGNCDVHTKRLAKRRLVSSQKPGKDLEQVLMQSLSLLRVDELFGDEQQLLLRDIRNKLSSLPEKKLVSLVHQLRESGFSGENAALRLLLMGVAISCFEPIQDPESETSKEMTSIFIAASQSLVDSTTVESFSLATECLEMLLRNRPKSITQWTVDNILGTFAVTLSASGPKISAKYSGVIYSRICQLLGLLFGQYRQKLSGRFHLILPVMQRLLRLLFTPSSRPQKSSRFLSATPPWIDNDPNASSTVREPSYATQFTRLLTTLCDPTVSAVQRGKRSDSGLTDNTKKVKSLAGQHLQYLVMEYAMCQLRGQLVPEMKAALMPGFYAVLDVMSKDTMRGMNAAMDSSSRAVFRGLYDDYVRFGKWNNG